MGINFSICLIVKNGASTLPRLFDSIKEFMDRGGEVCIVDTGSTDGSIEIARSRGAKVTDMGGRFINTVNAKLAETVNSTFVVEDEKPILNENDSFFVFSEARNTVAQLASNDMILCLDADEVITKMDIDEIVARVALDVDQIKYQLVFSHTPDGKEEVKFLQSKFYNRKRVFWRNFVHEMLVGASTHNTILLDESILKIEHFQNHETDRSGYMKGLSVDCLLYPNNDRNCHYFARELFYSGRGKSALKQFKRHLAMTLPPKEYDTTPTHMESLLYIGNIYGLWGDLNNEVNYYLNAMFNDPTHRNPVVRLAQFYKWHGDKKMALVYANKALEFPWSEKYGVSKDHFNDEVLEIRKWSIGKIPKRIISMWIGDEMPDVVKECVATHKIEGYEHMWIDNSNYHEFDCTYLQECLSAKRYGKASDFLRMKYLEKYGGIYLDADTKVIKPFDDVLDNELFVCVEKNIFIANGVVGAIPGHPMITEYLRRLTTNFRGDGDMVFQPGMALWTDLIRYGGWMDKVKVYPQDWFLPFDWQTGEVNITENTHTHHLYLRSWQK